MVAISLYRGNLHRVPEVPRTWRMPPRVISVGEFKALLERRSRTLARLQPPETAIDAEEEGMGESGCPKLGQLLEVAVAAGVEEAKEAELETDEVEVASSGLEIQESIVPENNAVEERKTDNNFSIDGSKTSELEASLPDGASAIDQRKRELEEKLYLLNEKKHHLVQMLKQILNAEEEMKKRSSIPMPLVRANFPPQTDLTTESGSSMKIMTPRMTVEVNFGESEESPFHGPQGRNPPNIQSPSPSPVSSFNKPAHGFFHNSGNSSRGTPASTPHGSMTASPLSFAPQGL